MPSLAKLRGTTLHRLWNVKLKTLFGFSSHQSHCDTSFHALWMIPGHVSTPQVALREQGLESAPIQIKVGRRVRNLFISLMGLATRSSAMASDITLDLGTLLTTGMRYSTPPQYHEDADQNHSIVCNVIYLTHTLLEAASRPSLISSYT